MVEPVRRSVLERMLAGPLAMLVGILAIMWTVEIVDTALLGDRLQSNGIGPRRIGGLDGILWTPWLHSTWGHILSNSVPFLALGWLVALRGRGYWLTVTIGSVLLGGAATWLLAGGVNHIGASGVVFGYLGALLGGAFFERRPAVLAPALVALLLYSTMLVGIVPQDDISWEGHLFGMLSGIAVAKALAGERAERPRDDDSPRYPWELDEPWLDPD